MSLWLQLILICFASSTASFAASYLLRGSTSLRDRKLLLELQTEVATLASELSKVLALTNRISKRVALDQHRERKGSSGSTERGDPPPPGDKAAAKAYYLNGKSHQQVAREAAGMQQ